MALDEEFSDLSDTTDSRVADDEEKRRVAREAELQDVNWLMSHRTGRRFLWRLLNKAGVFRNELLPPHEMSFRCGERNMGVMLIADVHEACPDKYFLMTKEQMNDD